jgi:Phosphotransferase System HPr (HPr) Family
LIKGKVIIKDALGLHLRPAEMMSNEALRYNSSIQFVIRNYTANVKSVLSILGAGVKHGDEVELLCEGEDEQEAYASMMKLLESGLEKLTRE